MVRESYFVSNALLARIGAALIPLPRLVKSPRCFRDYLPLGSRRFAFLTPLAFRIGLELSRNHVA